MVRMFRLQLRAIHQDVCSLGRKLGIWCRRVAAPQLGLPLGYVLTAHPYVRSCSVGHRELATNRNSGSKNSFCQAVWRAYHTVSYAWDGEDDAAAGLIGVASLSWMEAGGRRDRCLTPCCSHADGRLAWLTAHPCRRPDAARDRPALHHFRPSAVRGTLVRRER